MNHKVNNRKSKRASKKSRAEKSRCAAKMRRDKEGEELARLAEVLPFSPEVIDRLDKGAILRLTICYLQLKQYTKRDGAALLQDAKSNNRVMLPEAQPACDSVTNDMLGVEEGALMLEALNGFLVFVNKRGRMIYVSEQVAQHLGQEQVDMIGRLALEYIHQDDQKEFVRQFLQRQPPTGHPLAAAPVPMDLVDDSDSDEVEDVDPECFVQERLFYVRMKCHIIKKGNKTKQTGYMLTQWTGRLRLMESTREPGKMAIMGLVAIVRPMQSSPVLEIRLDGNMFMSRHDMSMKFTFCDPRISSLIGYEPNELIGRTAYQFHNPSDAKKIHSCHSSLISKGTSVSKYYRFLGKDGRWVWMQTRATVIYNTTNEPQYVVCMNYIISEDEGNRFLMMENEQSGMKNSEVPGFIDMTMPSNGESNSDNTECTNRKKSKHKHCSRATDKGSSANSCTKQTSKHPTGAKYKKLKPDNLVTSSSDIEQQKESPTNESHPMFYLPSPDSTETSFWVPDSSDGIDLSKSSRRGSTQGLPCTSTGPFNPKGNWSSGEITISSSGGSNEFRAIHMSSSGSSEEFKITHNPNSGEIKAVHKSSSGGSGEYKIVQDFSSGDFKMIPTGSSKEFNTEDICLSKDTFELDDATMSWLEEASKGMSQSMLEELQIDPGGRPLADPGKIRNIASDHSYHSESMPQKSSQSSRTRVFGNGPVLQEDTDADIEMLDESEVTTTTTVVPPFTASQGSSAAINGLPAAYQNGRVHPGEGSLRPMLASLLGAQHGEGSADGRPPRTLNGHATFDVHSDTSSTSSAMSNGDMDSSDQTDMTQQLNALLSNQGDNNSQQPISIENQAQGVTLQTFQDVSSSSVVFGGKELVFAANASLAKQHQQNGRQGPNFHTYSAVRKGSGNLIKPSDNIDTQPRQMHRNLPNQSFKPRNSPTLRKSHHSISSNLNNDSNTPSINHALNTAQGQGSSILEKFLLCKEPLNPNKGSDAFVKKVSQLKIVENPSRQEVHQQNIPILKRLLTGEIDNKRMEQYEASVIQTRKASGSSGSPAPSTPSSLDAASCSTTPSVPSSPLGLDHLGQVSGTAQLLGLETAGDMDQLLPYSAEVESFMNTDMDDIMREQARQEDLLLQYYQNL